MKKRIIVVEDDQDLLLMLTTLLNNKGYEVLGFPNGVSIVEGHCQWPDLFILDKEMEYIDGLAITKYLRTQEAGKRIPVVMLSGAANRKSASAAGVDFFLQKPFNVNELISTIDKYLNSPDSEYAATRQASA